MGQRTLAFTKQMLRIFCLIELEELYHLVANAWSSIPWSSETNCDLIAMRSEDEQAQANKRIHMHKNITPYKIKCYKSEQYKLESASTVTRGWRSWASIWWRQVSSDLLYPINFIIHQPAYHDQPKDWLALYLPCPWLPFGLLWLASC